MPRLLFQQAQKIRSGNETRLGGELGSCVCPSDGRLKAEGMFARLANFLCTGRIMIAADVAC